MTLEDVEFLAEVSQIEQCNRLVCRASRHKGFLCWVERKCVDSVFMLVCDGGGRAGGFGLTGVDDLESEIV